MDTLDRLCQLNSWDDFTEVAIEVSKECEMEMVQLIEPVKVRQVPKYQQDVRYDLVGVVPKYIRIPIGRLITQTPKITQGTDSLRPSPDDSHC